MKQLKLTLFALAAILFGCQEAELSDPNDTGAVAMKTVTVSAGMDNQDTKASLDSQTGAFTWQSGDLISVLATDGKFYDFVLTEGKDTREAIFEGSIPQNAQITTVATYPRIVANGVDNTVLSGNNLNYQLPATWDHATDVSNVPMVATFGEGAEHMSFKQVGGVMRFPVKNLPTAAQFVVTMADKTITGQFPVDITKLGEVAMVAGAEASVLTINYTSEVDGAYAEFNVPVPTGTYNNFKVEVKDSEEKVLFEKNYSAENTVNRATLLNMKELVLPERPMAISEVWPFFVDARAVFGKHEGITQYAVYVDDAAEPVIVDAEDFGEKVGVLFGGNFAHASTHKVSMAKVVDGTPVAESKSEAVEFTTADMRQLTVNTGTKFVTVGWDDVAVGWGPKWDAANQRYTAAPKTDMPDDGSGLKLHQKRGYQVQLFAADKQTVIYDMITFDGHSGFTNTFSDSSWIGKVGGQNIMIPTALSFGYLEPGKDYYFRVKTLDEPVVFDATNGNYLPEGSTDQPYPYTLTSERGGCAWSELVKLSTDPAHVPSENEILYEGFNDIMVHSDYINMAPAVVPDLDVTKRQSWDDYVANSTSTGYPAFLNTAASERKWTAQAFASQIRYDQLGLTDNAYEKNVPIVLNSNAGSLEGWAVSGSSEKRSMYPIFGAVRFGQSGSNKNGARLYTPVINSDKLLNNKATKCIVTVQLAYCSTSKTEVPSMIHITRVNNDIEGQPAAYDFSTLYPEEFQQASSALISENDYVHYQRYYEIKHEVYIQNGDKLIFEKPANDADLGMLVIGDIKVEVVPGEYEQNPFVDDGVGTEPDDTDYDVFKMGEFPISYWWNIPTAFHNYDEAKTRELYQQMAESGINVVNYVGEVDGSLEENVRIMNLCTELGMKFIGNTGNPSKYDDLSDERIALIKEHLATSDTYVGEYLVDEPSASRFDALGDFTRRYLEQIPDKEVYINLFPMYAKPTQLGANTYEEHIEKYLDKIPTKSVSYDYYGLKENGTLGSDYYTNLDIVRSKTVALRKPFWVITQTGKVLSNRMPTEKEERWTVWSTIAGGSKGIAYFCYWNPGSDDLSNSAMVNRDGQKTEQYDWIKQINADIYTIGTKLLPCHADGMILTHPTYYPLYDNNGKGRTNYGPVKAVSGSTSIACGCFRDARRSENGDNYKGYKVMVVSMMPTRDADAYLTLDTSVSAITITQNNTTSTVQLTNTLNTTVGDITVTFDGARLTLGIPEGEAALLEF